MDTDVGVGDHGRAPIPAATALARLPSQPAALSLAVESLAKAWTEGDRSSPIAAALFDPFQQGPIAELMAHRILLDSMDIAPALATMARMARAKMRGLGAVPGLPRYHGALRAALQAGGGRLRLAEALIQAGADVNAISPAHDTPLHLATHRGHLDAMRMLMRCGADLELRDKGGDTPLHTAIKRGQAEACALLGLSGADLEALDNAGQTPLQLASQHVDPLIDCAPILMAERARRERLALAESTPAPMHAGRPRARI